MSLIVYTLERASRELGVSSNHLFNLCILGQGPKARRVEAKGRAFILADDLHEWAKSRPVIHGNLHLVEPEGDSDA